MRIDAAHYLQVYDLDLLYSWTPNEFKDFLKGAQHRQIDEFERMAKQAMMNRYATNAKDAKEKKMFDAEKARKRLNNDSNSWKDSRSAVVSIEAHRKAKEAMKAYMNKIGG